MTSEKNLTKSRIFCKEGVMFGVNFVHACTLTPADRIVFYMQFQNSNANYMNDAKDEPKENINQSLAKNT